MTQMICDKKIKPGRAGLGDAFQFLSAHWRAVLLAQSAIASRLA